MCRGALLAGANEVIATWQGKRPIKAQWLLQYWGLPMTSWLPAGKIEARLPARRASYRVMIGVRDDCHYLRFHPQCTPV